MHTKRRDSTCKSTFRSAPPRVANHARTPLPPRRCIREPSARRNTGTNLPPPDTSSTSNLRLRPASAWDNKPERAANGSNYYHPYRSGQRQRPAPSTPPSFTGGLDMFLTQYPGWNQAPIQNEGHVYTSGTGYTSAGGASWQGMSNPADSTNIPLTRSSDMAASNYGSMPLPSSDVSTPYFTSASGSNHPSWYGMPMGHEAPFVQGPGSSNFHHPATMSNRQPIAYTQVYDPSGMPPHGMFPYTPDLYTPSAPTDDFAQGGGPDFTYPYSSYPDMTTNNIYSTNTDRGTASASSSSSSYPYYPSVSMGDSGGFETDIAPTYYYPLDGQSSY